jgi:paraquat-inducible protein A
MTAALHPDPDDAGPVATGKRLGLYGCPTCGRVSRRLDPAAPFAEAHCPRCDTPLHHRDPHSLQRTWACTLAAIVLYAPANLLPIMSTRSVLGNESHTLLGGIHELWMAGDWHLAVIVFVASMAVPVLKLLIVLLLAVTSQRRSRWRSLERARLYRLVEAVGHWSMLDVFVVVLLVGMIHFGPVAGVQPGPGLLAFGAVVVLTILAAASFDPRLLWPEPSPNPSFPPATPPGQPAAAPDRPS